MELEEVLSVHAEIGHHIVSVISRCLIMILAYPFFFYKLF